MYSNLFLYTSSIAVARNRIKKNDDWPIFATTHFNASYYTLSVYVYLDNTR